MNSTKNPLYPFEPERLCLQASAVNQSSYTLLNIRVYHPYRFVDAYAGIHNDWHDQIWTHTREQGCKCRPNIHGTAVYQFRRTLSGFTNQLMHTQTDRQADRQQAFNWFGVLYWRTVFFRCEGHQLHKQCHVAWHQEASSHILIQTNRLYIQKGRPTNGQTDRQPLKQKDRQA